MSRTLRVGAWTAVYDAGDLRRVCYGPHEVARRWHALVRDRNWGTVPGEITDERVEKTADGFRISYVSTHRRGEIDFAWRAEIIGSRAGIDFMFDGTAGGTFLHNRIGFCVLHPPQECAGKPVLLNGVLEAGFPDAIAPENPFHDLTSLEYDAAPGVHVSWKFEGDLFETEDQRNWTDGSFKTFCTPLRLPFPVEVAAGTRVQQTVRLRATGPYGVLCEVPGPVVIDVRGPATGDLPKIGLARADGPPPTENEAAWLRAWIAPQHLRVELSLAEADLAAALRSAAEEAEALGAALELVLTFVEGSPREYHRLAPALQEVRPRVARVLAFADGVWVTPGHAWVVAEAAFEQYDSSVPIYSGTTANFAEFNRGRPVRSGAGGYCWSAQPQEHAFDDASLLECCAIMGDTVRSARRFCGDKPLAVTPITLKKRVNPYATGPAEPDPPDRLPRTVDERQELPFGAVWTLAALKHLAEAGTDSLTFFETVGWRGVRERDAGSPLPDLFPSVPGHSFPLAAPLWDAAKSRGWRVVPCRSSDPLRAEALVLRNGSAVRVLLANLTMKPQAVVLTGLPSPPRVSTGWQIYAKWNTEGERMELVLPGYAYVRLDG